jgi:glycosyltransferase involved in cell wall biosynthesis
MKTFSKSFGEISKSFVSHLSPIKVSMHVVGTVSKDIRVMREASALVAKRNIVSIVDIVSKGNSPAEENFHGVCIKHILMSRSFANARFSKWGIFRAARIPIYSLFLFIQTPTDIYHAHDVIGFPACYIAALLRRKPLIFDAHELPFSKIHAPSSWLFTLLTNLFTKMVQRCAGVITVSSPIAQEIQNNFHASKVSLVRHVPPHQVIPKSDQLRHRLGLRPEVRIASYQGNIQSDRGLDNLIRSAAFLEQDIVIVLMGNGIDWTLSELEAFAIQESDKDALICMRRNALNAVRHYLRWENEKADTHSSLQ